MEENPCNNTYPVQQNAPAIMVLKTNPFPMCKCTDDAESTHTLQGLQLRLRMGGAVLRVFIFPHSMTGTNSLRSV